MAIVLDAAIHDCDGRPEIAYTVRHTNGGWMLEDGQNPAVHACPYCGELLPPREKMELPVQA